MRIWYDTEFMEDGKRVELLSIGLVAEDGRELYLENSQADIERANDWVKANVIPHLHICSIRRVKCDVDPCPVKSLTKIKWALMEFCDPEKHGKPEFWTYYGAYDHLALCQIFGKMIDLPKGWPMYSNDLKQWAFMLGDPRLPEQDKDEHHALADARWNKNAWEFLHGYAWNMALGAFPYIVNSHSKVFQDLKT